MNLLAERDLIRYLCPWLDTDDLSDIEVLQLVAEIGSWEPDSFALNSARGKSAGSREPRSSDSRARAR